MLNKNKLSQNKEFCNVLMEEFYFKGERGKKGLFLNGNNTKIAKVLRENGFLSKKSEVQAITINGSEQGDYDRIAFNLSEVYENSYSSRYTYIAFDIIDGHVTQN